MSIDLMQRKNTRIMIVQVLFIITSLLMIIRLFTVCLSQQSKHIMTMPTNAYTYRPTIVDRNGVKLAMSLESVSLYTHPNKIKNIEEITEALQDIFHDISYDSLYSKLSSKHSFTWIKRHLTPHEQHSINNLGIPDLKFQSEQIRIYIFGNIFAHILGYVDIDGNGLAGLERYIDNVDNDNTIMLSVDSRIQSILDEELNRTVSQYRANGAAGIILNANNSEILAMVSLPNFDPHKLSMTTNNQKFNRATLGLYEFGSILKPFTIAAALNSGLLTPDSKYDVSRPLKIGKFIIKDFFSHPTPKLTVEKILTRSSNVGMARIGIELGPELQKQCFKNLGFFSSLDIEIPEKSNTISQQSSSNINTASISYGYGISSTLLHVTQATAAIVNGGKFQQATLFPQNNNIHTQVLTEQTSATIRELMRSVVRNGTGRRANAKGYSVGGKTGSSEKSINGVYAKDINVSSFIAAFPMSSPEYVIAIMIDEPKPAPGTNTVTGGIVVGPLVKNLVNRIAPILNILPE